MVLAVSPRQTQPGSGCRGTLPFPTDAAIYEEHVKVAERNGTKKPAVVPVLEVTEIDDLTAGAKAGTIIEKD